MANTYTKIASVSVGSGGASSMDFTSIPSTYTDLLLKVSARDATSAFGSSAGISWQIQFNGLSTNLTGRYIFAGGSCSFSTGTDASNIYGIDSTNLDTANTFSSSEVYIPNYLASVNKSMSIEAVAENNAAAAGSRFNAGLWSSTAAITSIKLLTYTTFTQYSTATLYGIKNS
jgi:hypothetical protein